MHPKCTPNAGQMPGATRRFQIPCLIRYVQETQPITTETLGVTGVEVVAAETPKGKQLAGPFQPYELELLRAAVRPLRPRREDYVVAPDGDGMSIYRRARK